MTDLRTILGDKYDDTIEKVAHAIDDGNTTDYLGCGCCTSYDYDEAVKRTGHDVRAYMAAHDALAAVLPDLLAAAERDRLAGLLDEPRRSGCAVEIAGVRIAPCDERGQTADMRALDTAADRLAHMREARDNARAEVERLTGQIEAAKRIGLGHIGRPWADVLTDVLRALDGEADQEAQNRP